ncbi:MAG TPA: prepilin-type cleavage/methylation domain-containing protein [Methylotenera sp.]|nr:prepilin-type cleavage/methylation domain-containing protein [Methylotenera sp.]HPH05688.1 prepilin-type cleavage/methylation domain-containing protein [Methylotenera sp.]HPN01368.1 prepilin-type cleavage/methylation domain-containing protein [Methylotenera sp.]
MSLKYLSKDNSHRTRSISKLAFPVATKFQNGIALLEALIALLIFSFGVLGIVGLQSSMIKGTTQAKVRTDASFIAQRRIAEMWADPVNLNAATYDEPAASPTSISELPSGLRTTTVTSVAGSNDVNVVVTVSWTLPGEPQHQYSAQANISPCNNGNNPSASCI